MTDIEIAIKLNQMICAIEDIEDSLADFIWRAGLSEDKISRSVAFQTAKENISILENRIGRAAIEQLVKEDK